MSYGQKDYPQIQGINGKYTIAEIGCFLTAFCNIELDYGKDIAPPNLNSFFVANNIYIDVDDGIRDDLSWQSITKYDPQTTTGHTVDHGTDQTAGWPVTSQSIVRFYYKSLQTGEMIFHFCKVSDAVNHLILDSWDGIVKLSPYGEPTGWAEYTHAAALPYTIAPITPKPMHLNKDAWRYDLTQPTIQAITDNHEGISPAGTNFTAEAIATHIDGYTYVMPNTTDISGYLESDCTNGVWTPPVPVVPQSQLATAAPATVAPNPNDTFVTKTILQGYSSPAKALSALPPVTMTFQPNNTYYIYNRLNGMVNITTILGQSGAWINPTKNVVPPVITPKDPVADTTWRGTYRAYAEPQTFYFLKNYKIFDVSGQTPKVCNVARGKKITVYGEFIKNNVEYYRLKVEGDTEFMYWYAVPILDQILGTHIIETESEAEKTDATFTYPQKLTPLDKAYLRVKTAEKWLDGIKKNI